MMNSSVCPVTIIRCASLDESPPGRSSTCPTQTSTGVISYSIAVPLVTESASKIYAVNPRSIVPFRQDARRMIGDGQGRLA